jgi:hypothetical protein
MKRIAVTVAGMLGVALLGAGFDAKTDVQNAAKKLGEQANYSWVSTPSMGAGGGGGARFQPGPTTGKIEKDGCALVSMSMGENATEAAVKGAKVALKTKDGWKTAEELQAAAGGGQQPGGQQPGARPQRDPAAFAARRLRNFKAPAAEAADLVEKAKELKEEGGAIVGEMTEAGAQALLSFGRGGRGGGDQQPPAATGAKGTVKFWVKDGVLCKYEYTVSGKMTFGDQEREINRGTTVEIKDVGSTKVEVPEEAKKKLE